MIIFSDHEAAEPGGELKQRAQLTTPPWCDDECLASALPLAPRAS